MEEATGIDLESDVNVKNGASPAMVKIGNEIIRQVRGLYGSYAQPIEESIKSTPGEFALNFKIGISGKEPTEVKTEISFVPAAKVKDSLKGEVYCEQTDMFSEEHGDGLDLDELYDGGADGLVGD